MEIIRILWAFKMFGGDRANTFLEISRIRRSIYLNLLRRKFKVNFEMIFFVIPMETCGKIRIFFRVAPTNSFSLMAVSIEQFFRLWYFIIFDEKLYYFAVRCSLRKHFYDYRDLR